MKRLFCGSLLAASVLFVSACASTSNTSDTAPEWMGDSTPIIAPGAIMTVSGMSCPKCANNIDRQLKSIPGVQSTRIDMGAGEVEVHLAGVVRPSRARLGRAIDDAGFTVSEVEIVTP